MKHPTPLAGLYTALCWSRVSPPSVAVNCPAGLEQVRLHADWTLSHCENCRLQPRDVGVLAVSVQA